MKANIVFVLFMAAVFYFVNSNIDIYAKAYDNFYKIVECRINTVFGHDCFIPLE